MVFVRAVTSMATSMVAPSGIGNETPGLPVPPGVTETVTSPFGCVAAVVMALIGVRAGVIQTGAAAP